MFFITAAMLRVKYLTIHYVMYERHSLLHVTAVSHPLSTLRAFHKHILKVFNFTKFKISRALLYCALKNL